MSPEAKLALIAPAFILVPIVAVIAAVPGAVNLMLNLRATPSEEGLATVYRVKALARAPVLIACLLNFTLIWIEVSIHSFGHWAQFAILALLGVYVGLVFMLPYKISLDHNGIHSYRLIRRDVIIPWLELSHVEKRHQRGNMTEDSIYLFRSKSGTTIAVDETVFDSEEILQRVRNRQPCPEKPYVRRRTNSVTSV